MTLTDIPQDLREELAVLADLLPEQSPLPYAKARLLVLSWTRLGEDALAWAGANLVMKIDPDPYEIWRSGIRTHSHANGEPIG